MSAAEDRDSELRRRMAFSLSQLGQRLRDDPELQHKVDSWVASAVGYVVDNYRGEVAKMISSTVERWDGDTTSRRMELQVGRDLQFIRINGTVVGGLAGLADLHRSAGTSSSGRDWAPLAWRLARARSARCSCVATLAPLRQSGTACVAGAPRSAVAVTGTLVVSEQRTVRTASDRRRGARGAAR